MFSNHDNIIGYVGYYEDDKYYYIILEQGPYGSLEKIISDFGGTLPIKLATVYMA